MTGPDVIQTLEAKPHTSATLPGVTIQVAGAQVGASPLVYVFVATAGESVFTKRYTIGSDEGLPAPIALQDEVDGYRQDAAEMAAVQEHLRLAAQQIT